MSIRNNKLPKIDIVNKDVIEFILRKYIGFENLVVELVIKEKILFVELYLEM